MSFQSSVDPSLGCRALSQYLVHMNEFWLSVNHEYLMSPDLTPAWSLVNPAAYCVKVVWSARRSECAACFPVRLLLLYMGNYFYDITAV